MTRRSELLAELRILREDASTPRIDTVRNRLDAARELLAMVEEEADDLHVLAYDRPAAARDAVVKGGQPDYALDTNGDRRARRALRALTLAAIDAVEILAEANHDAIRLLREGDRHRPRSRRVIEIEELAAGIDAQARRVARGEYTPIRREAQPDAEQASTVVDRLRRERDQARRDVERLTLEVTRLGGNTAPRRRRSWRSRPGNGDAA
ncbi:MAG TPA: hypothetical protein VGJ86_23685 [Acidimicrobiales bacterium]